MSPTLPAALLLTAFGFLLGALPFSVWLGRRTTGKDVRQYGDGNPGATNALRAGGWRVGLAAMFLDVFKGALPVGIAYFIARLDGPELVAAALAPTLGHAYSPFLGGRGGKALAVTLGAWIGLTLGELPVILLTLLVSLFLLLENDAWVVTFVAAGMLAYLGLHYSGTALLWIGIAQALLIAWKHRHGLLRPPRLRAWLRRRLGLEAGQA